MQLVAYRGYDKAVWEKVKEKGLRQFKMEDHELSLLNFNLGTAKMLKDMKKSDKQAQSV